MQTVLQSTLHGCSLSGGGSGVLAGYQGPRGHVVNAALTQGDDSSNSPGRKTPEV